MQRLLRIIKTPLLVTTLALSLPAYSDTNSMNNSNTNTMTTSMSDISGTYTCTGTDTSDNTQYTTDLTVTKSGDVYQYKGIEKGMDNKTENFKATGLFAKNSGNTFAATFWQEKDPTKSGVIITQIQPDGSWDSVWTWKDKMGVNTETCRKK